MPWPNPDTQFKPGNPGGPGRPKGLTITTRLRELLNRGQIDGKPIKNGKQVADLLAEVIVKLSLKGDYQFVKLLLDRVEPGQLDMALADMTAEAEERARKRLADRGVNGLP